MSAFENLPADIKLADEQVSTNQVSQFINEELAIHAAADQSVEREISHRLEPLAAYFPPNPRQIKRIINAVTMYHAVALQQSGLDASDPRWFQLVLWIVLLTEWPETWRLLATCPDLVEILSVDDPAAAIAKIEPKYLPGSEAATLREVRRIRDDRALMALIAGSGGRAGPVLDRKAIEDLLALIPVYSRKATLNENGDKAGEEEDQ